MLAIFALLCIIAQFTLGLPQHRGDHNQDAKETPINPRELAKRARYILHKADWASMASISIQQAITGSPFVSIKSMSDGTVANSSGIPYFYMTDLDVTAKDLLADDRCTILVSLLQTGYCQEHDLDPQDPACAKLFVTGKYIKLDKTSAEYEFAKNGLFERHPVMKFWPETHGFVIGKIDIQEIQLLDGTTHLNGGIYRIPIPAYLNANDFDNVKF